MSVGKISFKHEETSKFTP